MKIKNMAASGLSGRIFYGTMETKDGGHQLTVENNWIVVNPPCSLSDTLLIQKLNKGEKLAKYIKENP